MYNDKTFSKPQPANEASIFDELDQKRIAPQRFGVAIAVCILVTALSFVFVFVGSTTLQVFEITDAAMSTYLAVFFRRYLRNFRATPAVRWAGWNVGMNAAMLVLFTLNALMVAWSHQVRPDPKFLVTFNGIYMPVMTLTALGDLVVTIGQGVTLQKIRNDFIGLLRPMGIILAFVLPVCFLATALTEILRFTSSAFSGVQVIYLRLAENALSRLPALLMIAIFYRAMNYCNGKPGAHTA